MDVDDGLSLDQSLLEAIVFSFQLGDTLSQRIDLVGLPASLLWCQGFSLRFIPLFAPIGEMGRIKPLTAQQSAQLARNTLLCFS